eukprot:8078733-Alexandrium_andersonii.AAC.1
MARSAVGGASDALAALASLGAEAAVAAPARAFVVLPIRVPVCERCAALRALGWVAADERDWADKRRGMASRGWPRAGANPMPGCRRFAARQLGE